MFLISYLLIGIVFIAGCGWLYDPYESKSNNNISPPNIDTTVSPPRILSFNSYISWDKINYADSYDIYKNDIFIDSVTSTQYLIGDLTEDSTYYVIAKNNQNYKFSNPSNVITVSKNKNFFQDEILNLSNSSSYNGTISSQVREVIIDKAEFCSMRFNCSIESRDRDLIFELNNVKLNGFIKSKNDDYSRLKNDYNVIFDITNNCEIKADNGLTPDIVFDDNSEHDGIDGGKGDNAIILPTVIIRGSGNITISGGNGGNGGNGASTTTWSDKTIGKGSNGGDGGNGIITQYLIIDMVNEESLIKVYGGTGGAKGTPGNNVSLLTGPLVSAMWDDIYDIGKKGNNGVSVIGIINTIKGQLIRG